MTTIYRDRRSVMGLRFRTPIGSLREQRRKAEGQLPQFAGRASTLRYRNSESLDEASTSAGEFDKREGLIERLRSILVNEPHPSDILSEYQVIQDELARISHHQQAHRGDSSKGLVDLNVPRNMFFDSAAPFRYIVIDGGKNSSDFPDALAKLDSAPNNLDGYMSQLPYFEESAARSMPLTLLLSSDLEKEALAPKPKADPSHDAAQLTQSNVAYSSPAKERSVLPKSLILSLLDEK